MRILSTIKEFIAEYCLEIAMFLTLVVVGIYLRRDMMFSRVTMLLMHSLVWYLAGLTRGRNEIR